MKEWFRDRNFREESKDLIDSCNEIVEQYQSQGLRNKDRLKEAAEQIVQGGGSDAKT